MKDKNKSSSNNIDINENENDINAIKNKLINNLSSQKTFIQILEDNIKLLSSGNKEAILKQDKMNYILEKLIKVLGLPFSALINSNNKILDFYCNNYSKNPNNEIIKNILINFINVFNFSSSTINPSDNIINFMEKKGFKDAKNFREKKRRNKTEIESLYDDLIELYHTWEKIREMDNNIEEDGFNQLQLSLNEKIEKIDEIQKSSNFPESTIEFFKEMIKKIEDFKNQKNIKANLQLFEKNKNVPNNQNNQNISVNNSNSNNINYINNKNNEKKDDLNSGQFESILSKEELKKLREIPLKERTYFYKNEELAYGEDELTEFKNYIFPLIKDQEKELKRQYIGFLNSHGGRIYIGIDDLKRVKGIVLTYKNCDSLRNRLVGYSNDFFPKCRLDKIKVSFQ